MQIIMEIEYNILIWMVENPPLVLYNFYIYTYV